MVKQLNNWSIGSTTTKEGKKFADHNNINYFEWMQGPWHLQKDDQSDHPRPQLVYRDGCYQLQPAHIV